MRELNEEIKHRYPGLGFSGVTTSPLTAPQSVVATASQADINLRAGGIAGSKSWTWSSHTSQEPTTIQVISNVILAIDAFKHVTSCFDKLQIVLGHAGILQQDFTVEIGFVQELNNVQGLFLHCRKSVPAELTQSLDDIFHPFPCLILPLSDDLPKDSDEMTVDEHPPLYDTWSSDNDKVTPRTVSSEQGRGGSGGGGNDPGGSGGGLPGSGSGRGESDGSRDGSENSGGGGGGGPADGGAGGGDDDPGRAGGDGDWDNNGKKYVLRGDFESRVDLLGTQGNIIQTFQTRADIRTKVMIVFHVVSFPLTRF
jgi:hypothetical protein